MNATGTPTSLMAVMTSVALTVEAAGAADNEGDSGDVDSKDDDDGPVDNTGTCPSSSGAVSHAPLTQSIAMSTCSGAMMACTRAMQSCAFLLLSATRVAMAVSLRATTTISTSKILAGTLLIISATAHVTWLVCAPTIVTLSVNSP